MRESNQGMERRYYTPREVSDLLRVSPTTVMKLIHERRLYAVHVSDRIYRVPVGALRRFQVGDEQSYEPREEWVPALSPLGEEVREREPQPVGG